LPLPFAGEAGLAQAKPGERGLCVIPAPPVSFLRKQESSRCHSRASGNPDRLSLPRERPAERSEAGCGGQRVLPA